MDKLDDLISKLDDLTSKDALTSKIDDLISKLDALTSKIDDLTWKDAQTWKEVIDGVTVVHSGDNRYGHQGNRPKFSWEVGGYKDLDDELRDLDDELKESVKMYDSNGNRFYSNYESIEEANKAIAKLAERGITAIVGPKAPWRDKDGNMVPNRYENEVGVFVVSAPEKSDDFSSPKTR